MKYLNISLSSWCVERESPSGFLAKMRGAIHDIPTCPDVFVFRGDADAGAFRLSSGEMRRRSEEIREAICLLSDEFGFCAVFGSLPWKNDRGIGSRTWITNDFGGISAFYDQVHVRSFGGEPDAAFTAGELPVFFDVDGLSCSVVTGYDIYFPEYVRTLSLAGAKVLFVLTESPVYGRTAQDTVLRSLAIGNQLFLVACGEGVSSEREGSVGVSVFSPSGDAVNISEDGKCVRSARLDIPEVDRCRRFLPLERDRRPELYLLLTE